MTAAATMDAARSHRLELRRARLVALASSASDMSAGHVSTWPSRPATTAAANSGSHAGMLKPLARSGGSQTATIEPARRR